MMNIFSKDDPEADRREMEAEMDTLSDPSCDYCGSQTRCDCPENLEEEYDESYERELFEMQYYRKACEKCGLAIPDCNCPVES